MVLKHYENQGHNAADLPLVEWSCRTLMYNAQEQLHGFLRNLPNRWVSMGLRALIFPRGRQYSAPSDELGQEIVALITHPTEARERLCAGIFAADVPGSPLGALQRALERAEALVPLDQRLRDAVRSGLISEEHPLQQIESAERQGILNASEADQLRRYDALVMEITGVDDFDSSEIGRAVAPPPQLKSTGTGF
jgi:acyl-CoA dehydrogenase